MESDSTAEGSGEQHHQQPVPALKSRTTRPGRKRLFLVLSILLSFILGFPFWLKSTEIYRSHLPFTSIEEHAARVMSSTLVLPCYFHFVFTAQQDPNGSDDFLLQGLGEAVSTISKIMHSLIIDKNSSHGGCGSSFIVMASMDTKGKCLRVGVPDGIPVWPCGLMNSRLIEVMEHSDPHTVDEFLDSYSHGLGNGGSENGMWRRAAGGLYTILNINELYHGSKSFLKSLIDKQERPESGFRAAFPHSQSKTVIGKYRHAWVRGNNKDYFIPDYELTKMSDIAVRFFMNGGSYQHQNGISTEEKGETLPLAADGKAILSFSLLNAEPSDWIFDWDFNVLEKHFWSPVAKALRPVAHLAIESQVLCYTPKAVRSFWDLHFQTHVVQSKDLPFFCECK